MIPPHLSALPCGDCRNPTVTTTLQRVGNRFLCPKCRDASTVQPPAGTRNVFGVESAIRVLRRVQRGVSLTFLAASVTGFIVLPTFFDPADLRQRELSNTHASSQLPKRNLDGREAGSIQG